MDIKVKTFIHALTLIHSNAKKAKKCLLDKRLTLSEKKILNAWFLLKNCQHQAILDDMKSVSTENELVDSQKELILGLTYNNMGQMKLASKHLHAAFSHLEKYPLPEHQFICIYNLFVVSFNLSHEKDMENSLHIMDVLVRGGLNPRQTMCYEQCLFNFLHFKNRFTEAAKILVILEGKRSMMNEAMIMSHHISKFVFHLKQEDFNLCEETLEEMKNYRLFRYTPNFIFMRLTLEHLKYDKTLYFYEKDFKGSDSLFFQLKTIQGFEESNLELAEKFWIKLQEIDPELYHDGFKYKGQKNLFSLCLEKHNSLLKSGPSFEALSKNKVEAICEIFEKSSIPIPKDVLFEKLWGTKPLDQNDDDKLKNLIYYARKTKNLQIQYRKGCYLLQNESKPKKTA